MFRLLEIEGRLVEARRGLAGSGWHWQNFVILICSMVTLWQKVQIGQCKVQLYICSMVTLWQKVQIGQFKVQIESPNWGSKFRTQKVQIEGPNWGPKRSKFRTQKVQIEGPNWRSKLGSVNFFGKFDQVWSQKSSHRKCLGARFMPFWLVWWFY